MNPITTRLARFNLCQFQTTRLTAGRVALTGRANSVEYRQFIVRIMKHVPLLGPAFLRRPSVVTRNGNFFLIINSRGHANTTYLRGITRFVTRLTTRFTVRIKGQLVGRRWLQFQHRYTNRNSALLLTTKRLIQRTLTRVFRISRFRRLFNSTVLLQVLTGTRHSIFNSTRIQRRHMVLRRRTSPTLLQNRNRANTKGDLTARLSFAFIRQFRANSNARHNNFTTAQEARRTASITNVRIRIRILRRTLILVTTNRITRIGRW